MDKMNETMRARALQVFYLCSLLLGLKMLLMTLRIAALKYSKGETKGKKGKAPPDAVDIDRLRRANRNDLENIPAFIFAGYFYWTTMPDPYTAILLYIAYTFARFCHTFVYAVKVVPQPARLLSFAAGFVITAYMAVTVIDHVRLL